MKLHYPRLGESVALFAMSFVISESVIGFNYAVSAGFKVYGGIVSDYSSKTLRDGLGHVTSGISCAIQGRFFK